MKPSASAAADELTTLIERHDRSLRALAFRAARRPGPMDDALQEAYVRAFRALPRFRVQSAHSTWLYRFVYNACLDELRRAHAHPALPLDAAARATDEGDPAETVGGPSALAEALMSLPPDQRAAVVLIDAEGFDYRAAAEVLGVRVGTLASRLSRARSALRRALSTISEGAEDR